MVVVSQLKWQPRLGGIPSWLDVLHGASHFMEWAGNGLQACNQFYGKKRRPFMCGKNPVSQFRNCGPGGPVYQLEEIQGAGG